MMNREKIVSFFILILLMVSLLSAHAEVVVPVWGTPYTQDGITIECHYGTVTITSSNKNIVMVALKRVFQENEYNDGDNGGASNIFGHEGRLSDYSDYSDYSEYSDYSDYSEYSDYSDHWELWRYHVRSYDGQEERPVIGYDVWTGETTQLVFTTTLSEGDEIVVYQEGEPLPQKSPFAMYEYNELGVQSDYKLTIYYGYLTFLPERYRMGAEYILGYEYVSVEKYPFYVDGRSQTWAKWLKSIDISFDNSFAAYHPTSTSKWFSGTTFSTISFANLDFSATADMSYMFENCTIGELDMDGLSFSNHPIVAGMCSGSQIQHLILAENTTEADDDIFVGLGTPDQPCEIDAPLGFQYNTDTTQPYFLWKGGFFKAPVITFAKNF